MLQEHNTGLRQKKLFSTTISGYKAGYPVICRISGQRRISGRIPDIRHEQLAGYPVSGIRPKMNPAQPYFKRFQTCLVRSPSFFNLKPTIICPYMTYF